ncbi:hypothetical protein PMAYCL1PPCAC_31665 [Pristionchus mayeri]|uniref:Activin types I and II receptor domain-containing protein n=1 Tax=Pristionchus mayeri TaxID=1317129 RepID=A0AAN5IET6_9BILA|nr:hypothetical protein PMAYCL1PPCAC_31665 [Pristionchus mayeri]
MPPPRVPLLLTLFLASVHSSLAVECEACEGSDCATLNSSICNGTYCISSVVNPRWGKYVSVKGCLSGNMLAMNADDALETDGESETYLCSTNYCTSREKNVTMKAAEPRKKISCACTEEAPG